MSPVFYEQRPETVFFGPICAYPFPSHVHDVVEIVCLTAGSMQMNIGSLSCSLTPGDIAVVFPAIPHSYEAVSEDAKGLSLIFLPDTISEFTTRFRTSVPVTPLVHRTQKPQELDDIILRLQKLSTLEESPLKLGYLHLFLAYLFSCITMRSSGSRAQSSLPYQVLHYISEHFTEPLSLESTARALGISRTHLSHIFSQQLRINFRQYINTLRIDRACTLLRDPAYSVSQITDLCGYSNPRTFHRAFLAQCHVPPNQYRARIFGAEEKA